MPRGIYLPARTLATPSDTVRRVKTWTRLLLILLVLALPLRAAWADLPMPGSLSGSSDRALLNVSDLRPSTHGDCHGGTWTVLVSPDVTVSHPIADLASEPALGEPKAHGCCLSASLAALPVPDLVWLPRQLGSLGLLASPRMPALSFLGDVQERPPRSA